MENENIENDNSSNVEANDTQDVAQDQEVLDAAALKKERDELAQTNRQLFERAKKAEGFVKVDGKWVKAPKPEEGAAAIEQLKAKTGELDETQLDYLDLKGISEEEDIAIIQKVIQRTGQTVRQALKDDYVLDKLKANQQKREVKDAMPSGTKRSGAGGEGFDAALAKFEQTGELPKDYALRTKVVNAAVERTNTNKPAWH